MTATEARRIVLSALASAAPVPAAATDATIPTLEDHDRRYHPNGHVPGDRCKFREALARGDMADLLVAEEEEEELLDAMAPGEGVNGEAIKSGTAKSLQLGTPPAEPPSANAKSARRNFVVSPEMLADFQSRVNGSFHTVDNLIRKFDNGSPMDADIFIPRIADKLHMSDPEARSHYRTYALPDGTVFTLRVSDHSSNPQEFNAHGTAGDFNISLVVQPPEGDTDLRGETPNVVIEQFSYDKDSLDRADIRLILESLRDLFVTGRYIDRTGKAVVDSQNIRGSALDADVFSVFDAAPTPMQQTLARHDARFHPNGYKPGDSCKFRDQLAKEDDADLLADAEKKEEMEKAEKASAPASSVPHDTVPEQTPPVPPSGQGTADKSSKAFKKAVGDIWGRYPLMNGPCSYEDLNFATNGRVAIAAKRDKSDSDPLPDLATERPNLVSFVDKTFPNGASPQRPPDAVHIATTTLGALQAAVDNAPNAETGVLYYNPSNGRYRICGIPYPERGETLVGTYDIPLLKTISDVFKTQSGQSWLEVSSSPSSGIGYFALDTDAAGAVVSPTRTKLACSAKDPYNCPYHHTGKFAWGAKSLDANDVEDYFEEMLPYQAGKITVDPTTGTVNLGSLNVPKDLLKKLYADKALAGWSVDTPKGPVPMGVGKPKGTRKAKTGKTAAPQAPQAPAAAPNPSPANAASTAAATPASATGNTKTKPVALPPAGASALSGLLSKLGNGPVADLLKKMYAMPKSGAASSSKPDAPKSSAPAEKPKSRAGDGPNPPLPTGSPKDFPATGTGPGDFDFSKFDTWDSAGSGSTRPRKVKVGGKLYFVKKAGVNPQYTPEAAANEVNANTALRLAGFYAPDSKLYKDSTGTYCVTLGADLSGGELEPKIGTPAVDQQLRDAYPVMALLYNTDILENADNAFLDSSGRIVFLDNGSTFGYSAQGKRDPVKKFGFDYDTRTDPDPKSPTGIMALADFSSHGGSLWRKALGSTASDRTENVLRAAAKYRMGDLAKEFIKRGLVPRQAKDAFQQYADGIDALSAKYAPPASATDSLEGIPAGRTPASLRLHRVLGDITGIGCDAIVNAANSTLLGGGGVDGAIHKAAGPALLEACRALPEVSPGVRCPAGESRVTEAYDLPACYVIHTVGPVYQGGGNGEAEVLASCYRSALELARECGCTSVAFPAISTGVYGYPAGEASEIAEREVLSYLEEDPDMDVTLVTYAA